MDDPFEVVIYASGFVACSVCAHCESSIEDVTSKVNAQNPTSLGHGWQLSEAGQFADGTPMPHRCEADPDRVHYLFEC